MPKTGGLSRAASELDLNLYRPFLREDFEPLIRECDLPSEAGRGELEDVGNGVDRLAVEPQLEMELWLNCVANGSVDDRDELASGNTIALPDPRSGRVDVDGLHPVAVVDLDPPAGPVAPAGPDDLSSAGRLHARFVDVNVDSLVGPGFPQPVVARRAEVRQAVPDHVLWSEAEGASDQLFSRETGQRAGQFEVSDDGKGWIGCRNARFQAG